MTAARCGCTAAGSAPPTSTAATARPGPGATTIDPNHSAQVEGDHYLHSHTPAQLDALEEIIEQAQTDLRRKAEPAIVVTGAGRAEFAAGSHAWSRRPDWTPRRSTALLTGDRTCSSPPARHR